MPSGKLLVIGTPIGNLSDISDRALQALRSCSLLLCEDTRHTRKLLTHFGINTRTESFHDHNEDQKAQRIIDTIGDGAVVGIVSDAGMPVISDPGFSLVRLARLNDVIVEPVPGPFAGVLALVASGIAPLPFAFYGFTPHKSGERVEFYRDIAAKGMTAIVYESPQRLVESLRDARGVLGDVDVTVAREMTKLHEEFVSGSISETIEALEAKDAIRGEITIVFAAKAEGAKAASPENLAEEFGRLRDEGMRRTDAAKLLAEKYGLKKSDVYKLLLGDEG